MSGIWPYFVISLGQFWVVLHEKPLQEISDNAGTPTGYNIFPMLFLPTIYTDDTTLNSKYDWASDLWQQLELASNL